MSEKDLEQPEKPLELKDIKLSAKEKKFVGFYLGKACLNASKALLMCEVSKAKPENLRILACQMLKRPNVAQYIDLFQSMHLMSAEECLTRLSDFARGSIEDLVNEKGYFDYQTAQENDSVYLIKKLKRKTTKKEVKRETETHPDLNSDEDEEIEESIETSIVYEEVEFEIHDPLTALVQIGKHHKLFTDNHHLSGELEYVTFEIETGAKQADE